MKTTIETDYYWIYRDKFIIKPDFNGNLDKFNNLIKSHSQLIFSNYYDFDILFETNNKHVPKYDNEFVGSLFDKPIKLDDELTHITLGYHFNQPITLNKNLISLTLGNNFNQTIQLVEGLKSLTLGNQFNQPIQLVDGLKYLEIDSNHPIINYLPNTL